MSKRKKNQAAVSLGRLGGLARAKKCGKERLAEIGRQAAAVRIARKTPNETQA